MTQQTTLEGHSNIFSPILCDCCRSAPEHSVVVPERENKPDWKTAERSIAGTRNRNRCCNGTKLEAPPSAPSSESLLKLNGWCWLASPHCPLPLPSSPPPTSHRGSAPVPLSLADVLQVSAPLVPDASAPQRDAAEVECASRVQTRAVRRAVWGPAGGAGAAGAALAAWRETERAAPARTPALPHPEKVKTACFDVCKIFTHNPGYLTFFFF